METRDFDGGWTGDLSRPRRDQAGRRTCKHCGDHPAVFLLRGEVRRDREHVLCPRCWRSEMDRSVARLLLAS